MIPVKFSAFIKSLKLIDPILKKLTASVNLAIATMRNYILWTSGTQEKLKQL